MTNYSGPGLHADITPPPALPSLDTALLQVFFFQMCTGLNVAWILSNHQKVGSLRIFESCYPCRQTFYPCRRQTGSSLCLRVEGSPRRERHARRWSLERLNAGRVL